jgi:hypothetical protein
MDYLEESSEQRPARRTERQRQREGKEPRDNRLGKKKKATKQKPEINRKNEIYLDTTSGIDQKVTHQEQYANETPTDSMMVSAIEKKTMSKRPAQMAMDNVNDEPTMEESSYAHREIKGLNAER